MFIRTCQECGWKQRDLEPSGEPTNTYRNRRCRKCGSIALDHGSYGFEYQGNEIVRSTEK